MDRNKNKLNFTQAIALFAGVVVLSVDFFITDTFKIESSYYVLVSALYLTGIALCIKAPNGTIKSIVDIAIFGTCLYQFWVVILWLGYIMYFATSIPLIWFVTVFINTVLISTSVNPLVKIWNRLGGR